MITTVLLLFTVKMAAVKVQFQMAFLKLLPVMDTEELSASLIDRADNEIDLVPESKIFVFNEKYIDENVKIDADGLGTIILLGGQVDLQADIDRYTALLATAQEEHDVAQTACNHLEIRITRLALITILLVSKKYYRAIGQLQMLQSRETKLTRR